MGSQYHGPDWLRPYAMALWYPQDWLNGEWSKADQDAFERLYDFNIFGIRPFGTQFDDILNQKDWDLYSDRYQMDYKDIKDPRKFMNHFGQNATVRSSIAFVSSNVKRLYR